MTVTLRVLPIAIALVVAAACGGSKAPATNPQPAPTTPARDTAAERRAREAAAQQESTRMADEAARARQRAIDDSIANARAAEEAGRRESEMLKATLTATINFEFNKADLRDDAKAALDAKIPILLANTGVTVRIA